MSRRFVFARWIISLGLGMAFAFPAAAKVVTLSHSFTKVISPAGLPTPISVMGSNPTGMGILNGTAGGHILTLTVLGSTTFTGTFKGPVRTFSGDLLPFPTNFIGFKIRQHFNGANILGTLLSSLFLGTPPGGATITALRCGNGVTCNSSNTTATAAPVVAAWGTLSPTSTPSTFTTSDQLWLWLVPTVIPLDLGQGTELVPFTEHFHMHFRPVPPLVPMFSTAGSLTLIGSLMAGAAWMFRLGRKRQR